MRESGMSFEPFVSLNDIINKILITKISRRKTFNTRFFFTREVDTNFPFCLSFLNLFKLSQILYVLILISIDIYVENFILYPKEGRYEN